MENFSFNQTDIHNVLSRAYALVPGITKVMAISCESFGGEPEIYYIDYPAAKSTHEQLLPDDKVIEKISVMQKQKITFEWCSVDDLPFNVEKAKIKSLNVFDELEKNILMLSIPRPSNKPNDLYFFYFHENISNFTITHSQRPLNQENKLIVGSLLFNSVSTMLDIIRSDKVAFEAFKGNVNHVISSMEEARATIENYREKHNDVMLNYAREIIAEHSANYSRNRFQLSENAISKIRKFDGDISSFRDALSNALLFTSSIRNSADHHEILIDDYHLNFKEVKLPEPKKIIQQPASRQAKTMLWLDNLEKAAQIVYENKMPLTGKNVAEKFDPPITAPAISDKLKNHRRTIKDLMAAHPDKWTLVRNEFKPLINILASRFNPEDIIKEDQA